MNTGRSRINLPFFDFLIAGKHISKILICSVRMSWDSFDHPVSEFWMKFNFHDFWILFRKGSFIFVVLLYEIVSRIREFKLVSVFKQMKEHVFKLLSPVKISPLLLLVLMCLVKLNKLEDTAILVLLDVLFILFISKHLAFDV